MRALVLMVVVGCGHANGFTGDRLAGTPSQSPDDTCICGGSGDALQITVGAVVLAGLVVAKFWRR